MEGISGFWQIPASGLQHRHGKARLGLDTGCETQPRYGRFERVRGGEGSERISRLDSREGRWRSDSLGRLDMAWK